MFKWITCGVSSRYIQKQTNRIKRRSDLSAFVFRIHDRGRGFIIWNENGQKRVHQTDRRIECEKTNHTVDDAVCGIDESNKKCRK